MASLNRVYLIGNLTRDPEIRYVASGTAVGDIRLAVSRRFRTQQGEDREEVCYVDVVVWGRQAETCGEYLSKGSPLLVEGRLQFDEWEKDGQRFNKLRVVADRTQFLGSPRRSEQSDTSQGEAKPVDGPAPSPGPSTPQTGAGALEDDDNLPF